MAQETPQETPAAAYGGHPNRLRNVGIVLGLVAVLGGLGLWLAGRNWEETDDAQIDGHLHPIAAKVDGTVLAIHPEVEDNRFVPAGTVLLEIDPVTYQAEVARAQAEVARLEASAAAARADVPVTTANARGQLKVSEAMVAVAGDAIATEKATLNVARARIAQAEALAQKTEADRKRYESLLAKQEVSRSEYGAREADARSAQANLEAAKAEELAAQNRVHQAESRLLQQQADRERARSAPQQITAAEKRSGAVGADLARAQALLDIAKINLGNTKVVAPVGGIVGRKSVEVGQRVQTGQPLLTLIQKDDVWVTANFKETQLARMQPGQSAEVTVDSFGGKLFHGKVESIAGATGARFSLLPPENASGNFVKVVQRLPVRLQLDPGQDVGALRPGMSVTAKVQVR